MCVHACVHAPVTIDACACMHAHGNVYAPELCLLRACMCALHQYGHVFAHLCVRVCACLNVCAQPHACVYVHVHA